jgi:hypothetical protein
MRWWLIHARQGKLKFDQNQDAGLKARRYIRFAETEKIAGALSWGMAALRQRTASEGGPDKNGEPQDPPGVGQPAEKMLYFAEVRTWSCAGEGSFQLGLT